MPCTGMGNKLPPPAQGCRGEKPRAARAAPAAQGRRGCGVWAGLGGTSCAGARSPGRFGRRQLRRGAEGAAGRRAGGPPLRISEAVPIAEVCRLARKNCRRQSKKSQGYFVYFKIFKEGLIQSAGADCEEILRQNAARFPGNNRVYFKKSQQNYGAKFPQDAAVALNQRFLSAA